MRRANLMRHLYGLFIFICVICLFPLFPLAAQGATLADLAGTWNFSSVTTGPDAPFWLRTTLTIKPDGTFTGPETESDGDNIPNFTGSFSLSSSGFSMKPTVAKNSAPCQIDLGKTVMACTFTTSDGSGSSNVIVGVKLAGSYSNDDLVASDWEVNSLDGGPANPSWMRISGGTIDSTGNFQGTYSDSNGNTATLSAQEAISANGEVTCVSGDCPDPNYTSYMDASKSVIVGLYGVSATNPDAVLTVFTKMADSYSMDDLVGVWHGNALSPYPWWQRFTMTIKPDGMFSFAGVTNNGKSQNLEDTLSISPQGVITIADIGSFRMVINAGKTLGVYTETNKDGSTIIGVMTKTASLPGAPTGVSATPENKEAQVSFTQAAANGSPITTYTVTSSPDASHLNGVTAKGTKSPITVKGLTNGTQYTFTITATNAVGTGPASNPASNSVTPGTKPAAPTIGIITVGVGEATVNFTEKSDGGSPTTYTVTSNPGGGVDGSAGTTSLSHLVTGLTSGKKYTFTVTATNAFGKSTSTSKSVKIE